MKAYQIQNLKGLTSKLFLHEAFDQLLLFEASFHTAASFVIDGKRNPSFYQKEELEECKNRDYLLWSEVRPLCFQIIKGKRLPLSFRLVFLWPDHPEEADFLLNIRYDQEKLMIITGTNYHSFTRDRSLEQEWDRTAAAFLDEIGAEYLEM